MLLTRLPGWQSALTRLNTGTPTGNLAVTVAKRRAADWQLPAGSAVGQIRWPIPEWTPFLGSDLVTFTYEREVFLPMALTVPEDFDAEVFQASTRIEWQVCDEICIRVKQTLPFRFQSAPPKK